jgi:hypothetical protein
LGFGPSLPAGTLKRVLAVFLRSWLSSSSQSVVQRTSGARIGLAALSLDDSADIALLIKQRWIEE